MTPLLSSPPSLQIRQPLHNLPVQSPPANSRAETGSVRATISTLLFVSSPPEPHRAREDSGGGGTDRGASRSTKQRQAARADCRVAVQVFSVQTETRYVLHCSVWCSTERLRGMRPKGKFRSADNNTETRTKFMGCHVPPEPEIALDGTKM